MLFLFPLFLSLVTLRRMFDLSMGEGNPIVYIVSLVLKKKKLKIQKNRDPVGLKTHKGERPDIKYLDMRGEPW